MNLSETSNSIITVFTIQSCPNDTQSFLRREIYQTKKTDLLHRQIEIGQKVILNEENTEQYKSMFLFFSSVLFRSMKSLRSEVNIP